MEFIIQGKTKAEVVELIGERYGNLGKTAIYNRLELLGIKIGKFEGISGLDEESLDKLDRLNQWIQDGNSSQDFPERVIETGIVHREESGIEETSIPIGGGMPNELLAVIQAAQQKAAGVMMAQNILAQQMIDNPDLLPEYLKQQVEASNRAIAPKHQAKEYMSQYLAMAQNMAQDTVAEMIAI